VSELASIENSKKLDRILMILEGQPDQPGLIATVQKHHQILHGNGSGFGLVQKVSVMWRIHVWVLCTCSALGGYWLKTLIH
jgi:hypothetical protein